jgi:hypothetical protein
VHLLSPEIEILSVLGEFEESEHVPSLGDIRNKYIISYLTYLSMFRLHDSSPLFTTKKAPISGAFLI